MAKTDSDSPADITDAAAADSMRAQHSNEEAIAAVTGTKGSGISRVEGHATAWEMMSEDDLNARAAEVGVDPSGLSRDELIAKLKEF